MDFLQYVLLSLCEFGVVRSVRSGVEVRCLLVDAVHNIGIRCNLEKMTRDMLESCQMDGCLPVLYTESSHRPGRMSFASCSLLLFCVSVAISG